MRFRAHPTMSPMRLTERSISCSLGRDCCDSLICRSAYDCYDYLCILCFLCPDLSCSSTEWLVHSHECRMARSPPPKPARSPPSTPTQASSYLKMSFFDVLWYFLVLFSVTLYRNDIFSFVWTTFGWTTIGWSTKLYIRSNSNHPNDTRNFPGALRSHCVHGISCFASLSKCQ